MGTATGTATQGTAANRRVSTRSRRADATRNQILAAAREVFREHGYFDANVEHIITRCGISRGAFYYHFRNKDDVFSAVAIRAVNELGEKLYPEGRSEDEFERIYIANFAFLRGFLEYADIFLNLMRAADVSPRIKSLQRKLWIAPVSRIERHVNRQVDAGVCRQLDARITASALSAMVDGFCYRWLATDHVELPDRDMSEVAYELSVIWYLALYGGTEHTLPPLESLRALLPESED